MPLHPVIAPEILALRPDFTPLSIAVAGGANRDSDGAGARRLAEVVAGLDAANWAEVPLAACRGFGARPRRTPCSAEALRDGGLRPVDAVVDLDNAVSLRHAIPVGGEDAAADAGAPTLRRVRGSEPFDTVAEVPEPGEVIRCDATGVTCRRWNWRQGRRSQLTGASRDRWFVPERLEPMPMAALIAAGASLVHGLLALSPAAAITATIPDRDWPRGRPVALDA